MAGVEAASTGRKQPLKLAGKLFLQAVSASVSGAETVSTGCQQALWAVQKLLPKEGR